MRTTSERQTESLGERIGGVLDRGAIVGLVGPLGAGKTALVRGIARACGVDEANVHSPTFLTAVEYEGRMPVAHIDLYRHGDAPADPEWMAELLDGTGVAVVEWFDQLPDRESLDALVVEIEPGPGDSDRQMTLVAAGRRSELTLRALAEAGA